MSLIHYSLRATNPDGSLAWEQDVSNLTPDEGAQYITSAGLFGGAQVTSWYFGLIGNNYTASNASKASDIPALLQEFGAYDDTTRPAWLPNLDGVTATNSAAPQEITVTAGTPDTNVYGLFAVSTDVKNTGAGVMLSITKFTSPQVVRGGQTIQLVAVFDPRNPL